MWGWLKKGVKVVIKSEIPDKILESKGVPSSVIDFAEGKILGSLEKKVKENNIVARKPQPDLATYGLEELHIFPYYQTREEYEAKTGKPCPPYLDNGRPKYWEGTVDLNADPDLSIRFKVPYNSRGGVSLNPDKTPKLSELDLKPEEIVRVNIPSKQVGTFPGSASAVEIQPPCELLPNERLEFQSGIASAQLRVRRVDKMQGAITMSDRALLELIAKKVGAV